MSPGLRAAADGGVYTITLARPPLNILNIALLKEVSAALREARNSGCSFLIVEAEGKDFSAGADVGEHMPGSVGDMLASFHEAVLLLHGFEGLSIAKVRGAALGGGCELAMAADFVLASDAASFAQPEIKLGVLAPVAMALLPVLTSPRFARDFVLSGRSVDAAEALREGLVNRVFPDAAFEEGCRDFLDGYRALSRSSLKIAKRSWRKIYPVELEKKLAAAERAYLSDLLPTPDATEGCAAFLEKRKPVWNNS